ncbi:aldehyde dehydrogenase family protein [Actinoplanes subtropicus]|uniref:aldehyde dehydrogenase family protein n=1 Tax=Actinoplanes subtropicus TaxID=543632 RepID=UPI0004C37CFF|nr:aldehyde dehydrogenase family protein [Actinoplanes subtropicus]
MSPVVTVETFAGEDEAPAGTVWVNAHPVLAGEVPWGGFKGSGYGRDLSIYALDDYSRTKHVRHNVAR